MKRTKTGADGIVREYTDELPPAEAGPGPNGPEALVSRGFIPVESLRNAPLPIKPNAVPERDPATEPAPRVRGCRNSTRF